MPQSPTEVQPILFNRARGLNDQDSLVKREVGFAPFAMNLDAQSDVWDRRQGRFFSFLGEGMVTYYGILSWDDGTTTEVAVIGTVAYDMGTQFSYLLEAGVRLIIQSQDGTWWDDTPDAATGLINPISVVTPSQTPQTSNLVVQYYQPFGFTVNVGVMRLDATESYGGWYLKSYDNSSAIQLIQQDLVFSYASGFALKFNDINGNLFSLSNTNDGNFIATVQ